MTCYKIHNTKLTVSVTSRVRVRQSTPIWKGVFSDRIWRSRESQYLETTCGTKFQRWRAGWLKAVDLLVVDRGCGELHGRRWSKSAGGCGDTKKFRKIFCHSVEEILLLTVGWDTIHAITSHCDIKMILKLLQHASQCNGLLYVSALFASNKVIALLCDSLSHI